MPVRVGKPEPEPEARTGLFYYSFFEKVPGNGASTATSEKAGTNL